MVLRFAISCVGLLLAHPSVAQHDRPHPLHDDRDLEADELDAFADAELDVASDPVARSLVERARAAFCATSEARLNARCGDADVVIGNPVVLAGPAGPLATHVVRLDVTTSYGAGSVTYLHERDGSHSSDVYVCVARPDGPRCGHAQTRSLYYQEAERPCDDERARRVSRFRDAVLRRRRRTSPRSEAKVAASAFKPRCPMSLEVRTTRAALAQACGTGMSPVTMPLGPTRVVPPPVDRDSGFI